MRYKKNNKDYQELAKSRGFKWVGRRTININTKTKWECKHGHRWDSTYTAIRNGGSCPTCRNTSTRNYSSPLFALPSKESKDSYNRTRKVSEDYHALAKGRGFEWLGPEVPNTACKTTWKCPQGHQWKTTYSNIQQGWGGCSVCRKPILKRSPTDYHNLAEEKGYSWPGPKAQNANTAGKWQCKNGHEFESTYINIRNGESCPKCKASSPENSQPYPPTDGTPTNSLESFKCLFCSKQWEIDSPPRRLYWFCPWCGIKSM